MNHNTDLQEEINRAAQVVKAGGVVAFPTDTFYGLGCDPFNERAIEKIFEIKQRPRDKAILLLIASPAALELVVPPLNEQNEQNLVGRRFALLRDHFWPGPLTLVLPARSTLPTNLVSSRSTIGVRYPSYALTRRFAEAVGGVVTATSANLSGQPNTETAEQVRAQIGKGLDYILDGGASPGGLPSSIIDLTVEPPALVREGAISRQSLAALLGPLQ